jgi:hypothetical protein
MGCRVFGLDHKGPCFVVYVNISGFDGCRVVFVMFLRVTGRRIHALKEHSQSSLTPLALYPHSAGNDRRDWFLKTFLGFCFAAVTFLPSIHHPFADGQSV